MCCQKPVTWTKLLFPLNWACGFLFGTLLHNWCTIHILVNMIFQWQRQYLLPVCLSPLMLTESSVEMVAPAIPNCLPRKLVVNWKHTNWTSFLFSIVNVLQALFSFETVGFGNWETNLCFFKSRICLICSAHEIYLPLFVIHLSQASLSLQRGLGALLAHWPFGIMPFVKTNTWCIFLCGFTRLNRN